MVILRRKMVDVKEADSFWGAVESLEEVILKLNLG